MNEIIILQGVAIIKPQTACSIMHTIEYSQHPVRQRTQNRFYQLTTQRKTLSHHRQLPVTNLHSLVVGSGKSEISWHFPFASGCIVVSEVWCDFLVSADERLDEYCLTLVDYSIVVPVMI